MKKKSFFKFSSLALCIASATVLIQVQAMAAETLSAVQSFFCGQLESNSFGFNLIESNSQSYYVDAFSNNQFKSQLDQKVGSQVCLSNVLIDSENRRIEGDYSSIVNYAPGHEVRNIPATNCEVFADKAANVYDVAYGRMGPHPEATLNLFIKIYPERLDSKVRSVRFLGTHYETGWRDSIIGNSWLGSQDYFEFKFDGQMEGAFYVETERGTRYWFNQTSNLNAFGNFVLQPNNFSQLDDRVGSYGYKYPQQLPELDVARLPKTADAFLFLNPHECR